MTAHQYPEHGALRRALALLAETGIVPHAAAALDHTMENMRSMLRDAVLADVSAFSQSGNPDVLPQLDQHGGENLQEIRRLLGGGEVGGFDFVRTHAQRRAAQRFPLEATLDAYRCGHRILSRWLRDAAIAAGATTLKMALPRSPTLSLNIQTPSAPSPRLNMSIAYERWRKPRAIAAASCSTFFSMAMTNPMAALQGC